MIEKIYLLKESYDPEEYPANTFELCTVDNKKLLCLVGTKLSKFKKDVDYLGTPSKVKKGKYKKYILQKQYNEETETETLSKTEIINLI